MSTDLSIYLPMDRRQALARGLVLPDRTAGAALFADISGFTPITEALANELGPRRGAEELTKKLNAIYGALIAEVNRYHGSVIGFAGDAITCWFDGDWATVCARAVAAALNIQTVMQAQFAQVTTPAGSTFPLAIKVAVAAGPARRFQVGDPAIQLIDVLAGETLARLAAAEQKAEKGEVLVSAEVAQALRPGPEIREWRAAPEGGQLLAVVTGLPQPVAEAPWPFLRPDALNEEQVRPWLLPGMYARERVSEEMFLAELRPVTALFVRFGGLNYDGDADAGRKLDAYIRWAQSVVARCDGALLQLTVGDKGSYLYAAFGAPLAHDDDTARAVAAALDLLNLPADLGFITQQQMGLSQGRMRTGPYGGPTRRTYGVLGDEVNLAARLMSKAAPGQILVSQRVAADIEKQFQLELLGPVSVKGKQKPVLVSAVLGRKVSGRRFASAAGELVGREAELSRMLELLARAALGSGQVLRVEGPAGVGKSHLLSALAAEAAARGFRVAAGDSHNLMQDSTYVPWRPVLRTLLALSDDADPVAALEATLERANPDWLVRLPLLGDLLGLPIPDNATTAAFELKLRQSALFDLVVELLEHWAAAQPLLLLLDDVQWMDEASADLTAAVARSLAHTRLMLVVGHRPPQTEAALLPALETLPFYHRLDLDELSPLGVAALVANRLGGPPGPLALSLIQAETQGNPFFVEEVVNALRESGNLAPRADGQWLLSEKMFTALQQANALVRPEGHWVLAPDASLSAIDLGLPDSIQGVVLSRLDRLPDADRLTLKVGSVIGHTFAFDLVAETHPLRPEAEVLTEQLHRLEARDFARLESTLPRLLYIFKHNVTRDVAYETLLFDQRRQLHRAIGAALEQLAPEAAAQIALHAFAGEDWARALHYQLLAGQQAQRLFANHEGAEHLRKALRCAEHLPPESVARERRQIHISLGEVLATLGQYEAALDQLRPALELAQALGDREAEVHACRWIARVYEHRGEYAQALDWLQRGRAALADRPNPKLAELYAIGALISSRQGQYDLAWEQCAASVRLAEELDDPATQAFAYNARAHVALRRGNPLGAIEDNQRALALYEQVGNIQGQALACNGIGNTYSEMGRWLEAERFYRRARGIFIQTGDELHRVFVDNNLGEIARQQGRLDDAQAFYAEALHALERLGGSRYVLGVLQMNLGATLVRRRSLADARTYLSLSAESFAQAEARDYLPELHRHLAEAALAEADLAEATRQSERALSLARELTVKGEEGNALRVLGEIALARQDPTQAEAYLQESGAVLDEVGDEYAAARSRLALARVGLAQSRRAEALSALEQAEAVFERLSAQLDLNAAQELRQKLET